MLFSLYIILAIAVEFIGLKASLLDVCIFLHFVPGRMMQESSFMFSCMQIATPEKSAFAINFAAQTRFTAASELGLSELLCEPTRITGIGRLSSIKERAALV